MQQEYIWNNDNATNDKKQSGNALNVCGLKAAKNWCLIGPYLNLLPVESLPFQDGIHFSVFLAPRVAAASSCSASS